MPQFSEPGFPGRGWERGPRSGEENATRNGSPDLLVQNQGSQQVSPQSATGLPDAWASAQASGAEAAVCFAGVAQLVEHLFCKQVVRGSIPRASSFGALAGTSVSFLRGAQLPPAEVNSAGPPLRFLGPSPKTQQTRVRSAARVSEISESCPSGQREQAVNLPAYAYAGSNPALSTSAPVQGASVSIICLGELSSPSAEVNTAEPPPQVFGSRPKNSVGGRADVDAGVRSLGTKRSRVRSLRPVSRFAGVAQLVERQPSKLNVESSSLFSRSTAFRALTGPGGSHAIVTETHAHLAQLVEHVLGKDEVTSSNLVVGSKH
ncbi:MAG: hypothetical protein K0R38_7812 [Polyangiaceae bacterium]|nr:hypothetical protein [Polyangiaceae bacterium]